MLGLGGWIMREWCWWILLAWELEQGPVALQRRWRWWTTAAAGRPSLRFPSNRFSTPSLIYLKLMFCFCSFLYFELKPSCGPFLAITSHKTFNTLILWSPSSASCLVVTSLSLCQWQPKCKSSSHLEMEYSSPEEWSLMHLPILGTKVTQWNVPCQTMKLLGSRICLSGCRAGLTKLLG